MRGKRLPGLLLPAICASLLAGPTHSSEAGSSEASSGGLELPKGATFWQRTREGSGGRDELLLQSLERVLLGLGDEHDALTAQTVLIDYTRGQKFRDPRIELMAVRLRLETKWSFDRRLEGRLRETLRRPLPSDLVGVGWADFGALAALRGDAEAAWNRFDRAVGTLWERGPRSVALLGRGWAALARGRAPEAIADFEEARVAADDRRLAVAALWSLALALERRGQDEEAKLAIRRAGQLQRVRASASGRDPFDGVARVPAYEIHAIVALQKSFDRERAEVENDVEAWSVATTARCEALRQYLVHAEPDGSPWAQATKVRWTRCLEELSAHDEAPMP